MITLRTHPGAGLWLVPAAATVVRLRGELDLGTRETVRERLQRALQRSTGLLILDLSGVSFCDAAGLGVVVGVQHRARTLNIVIGLAAPRPHVAKVLRLTDLDRNFPMYGTIPGGVGSGPAAAC